MHPEPKNRKCAFDYDKTLFRQRHKVENMFAKLKGLPRRRPGTGAALPPDMTDAPTHSSQPSASQPPLPSILKNES
jgi:hypothetical protein